MEEQYILVLDQNVYNDREILNTFEEILLTACKGNIALT